MEPLRLYLFAAMVLHKLVWEVLRRRGSNTGRQVFRPIKALKIAVLGGLLLQCFLPDVLPITAEPRVLRVAGTLLLTLGLATAVAARVQLGRNWSDVESATVLPGQRLVAFGLYRHIRHPIYIGDILLVTGYELALNSWLWLIVIPLTAFVWKKAGQEEALLKSGLTGYAEYLETSGRFVPRNAAVGVAAVAIAFTLQFANVEANFNGNWSALFYTGSQFPVPPPLQHEGIHVFPNSAGYDGQFYHYMAHEPWPGSAFTPYIDSPRLRYPRILVPGLAYAAALGRQEWIDPAFHAISLLAFGLGAWWLGCYANLMGSNRYMGLLFLLVPGVLISLERVTVDAMLLALCCGFAYYAARGVMLRCYVVVIFAMLTRDTGFLLWGAYGLWLLINRRWARAVLFGTAALPAVAWLLTVRFNTAAAASPLGLANSGPTFWDHLLNPNHYSFSALISDSAVALDYLSIAGMVLAIILMALHLRSRYNDPAVIAGVAFAALPFALGWVLTWFDPFAYPRTLSPLLLFLGLTTFRTKSLLALAPLFLVLPRIVMELAPRLPWIQGLL